MTKPVVIVGGGISGLSLAYFLSRARPRTQIHVIEKSSRVGGWISSPSFQLSGKSMVYEEGPRSLRAADNGRFTLSLIEELSLQKEVIGISSAGVARNIFINGKVTPLPGSFLGFLTSSLTRKAIPSVISEYFKKASESGEDESIDAFFSRRFSPYVARTFIAPIVVGIYGGNSENLSIKCTFSRFKRWEEEKGSVLKGLFSPSPSIPTQSSQWIKEVQQKGIFSFRGGLETLVDALKNSLKEKGVIIHTDTNIEEIFAYDLHGKAEQFRLLLSSGKQLDCGNLFLTVNAPSLQLLLNRYKSERSQKVLSDLQQRLSEISYASLALVHLAYAKPPTSKMPLNGFGYLCSPAERQQIIGATFDSNVFPQQFSGSLQQTENAPVRVSVFLGGYNVHPENIQINHTTRPFQIIAKALQGLEAHLGISTKPDWTGTSISLDCIPQYSLNYLTLLHQIQSKTEELSNNIHLLGPSFRIGVGVNDCIANAKIIADHWADKL